MARKKKELEDIEIHILLEGIYRYFGHDFRDYAQASLRRRILLFAQHEGVKSISALQDRLFHEPGCIDRFLVSMSVNVTSMFRDPLFFQAVRNKIVPILDEQKYFRIWHAGCASGEEVYSMAIILKEHGLNERCKIYATDMNQSILEKAKSGIFPLKMMKEYTENYIRSGGKKSFSEYYTAGYDNALFLPELKKNIVWGHHNLVTDSSFNEFQMIICRNVTIYFNKMLQDHVHRLFYSSLSPQGILGLGSKETILYTPYEDCYTAIDIQHKLYRKIR